MKIIVPHLEWHAAHACNFTCESCSHFSNHGINKIVSLDTLKHWYSLWNNRIVPKSMAILGGEPLLNKQIVDIIYMTKDMWGKENEYFELVTNGFLLHKYPELPKALEETNCVLSISIHGNSKKYSETINNINVLLTEWTNKFKIKIKPMQVSTTWIKTYNGFGNNMTPYEDNDYKKSWDNCPTGQQCFQLLDEKIYKCSMLAYLPLVKQKYNLSDKWNRYLKYKPLSSDCSDQDILNFFNKKEEVFCSMCPSDPKLFVKKDPLLPITFYKKLTITNEK